MTKLKSSLFPALLWPIKKLLALLLKSLNLICITLLLGLRPMLGPSACRYTIGCTEYSVMQLREHSFFYACFLIAKRLLACNPWNNA